MFPFKPFELGIYLTPGHLLADHMSLAVDNVEESTVNFDAMAEWRADDLGATACLP